jgi:hypothetical protein
MRISLAIFSFAAALLAATPAAATQGLSCRPISGGGPIVGLVIGGAGLAGVNLTEGRTTRSTMGPNPAIALRQSWIDEDRFWVDLTDPNFMEDLGRLRLHPTGRGDAWRLTGTFVQRGRLYRLSCEES